jgi:hypothetical protein
MIILNQRHSISLLFDLLHIPMLQEIFKVLYVLSLIFLVGYLGLRLMSNFPWGREDLKRGIIEFSSLAVTR